jgi:predicted transport protein
MDWIIKHKDAFYVLVLKKLGQDIAEKIEWNPKLYCIANNFTKYDENAINQMGKSISLYRYKKYQEHMLFELLSSKVDSEEYNEEKAFNKKTKRKGFDLTFSEKYNRANKDIQMLYDNLRSFILSLGDDITENKLKLYVAYKKIKNIVCVEVHKSSLVCYLRLNPETIILEDGFTKDMTNIGHWGTGDVEMRISNKEQFEKAKHLIEKAYNEN